MVSFQLRRWMGERGKKNYILTKKCLNTNVGEHITTTEQTIAIVDKFFFSMVSIRIESLNHV